MLLQVSIELWLLADSEKEGINVQLPDHQTLLNGSQGKLVANVIGLVGLNLIL